MKTAGVSLVVVLLAFLVLQPRSRDTGNLYVDFAGSDSTGDGSAERPWRSIGHAISNSSAGQTIKVSQGIFIEDQLIIPPHVSVEGAGLTQTIIKANPALHYHPANPGFAIEHFLIQLTSPDYEPGEQRISDLLIDGDNKKLHGGIFINKRKDIVIENVRIQNTNFSGLWLWNTENVKVTKTEVKNCSWGSTAWCSGAINLGELKSVEIDNCLVDEDTGYGIKTLGPKNARHVKLIIRNSVITVNPEGLWNEGLAPNISIELLNLVDSEIHHCYVDNHISVANDSLSSHKSVRIHHNILDLSTRAKGHGYGLELSINNVEVDNNYFVEGVYGIANWGAPKRYWEIHHNVFYDIKSDVNAADIIRSQEGGLHDVRIFNNTIEYQSGKKVNFVGLYGGESKNIQITNNLLMNTATPENDSADEFIHLENGATIKNLEVSTNLLQQLAIGKSTGGYKGNVIADDPEISKEGSRPSPYYHPREGSILIDGGTDTGYPYEGNAPDIGAFEVPATMQQSGSK